MTYIWNDENRLVNAINPGTNRQSQYLYDGLGRRIMSHHHNHATSEALQEEIRYLYDGWNVVAKLDSVNNITRNYIWGSDLSQTTQGAGGVGGLLAAVESSSEVYEYFYDGNGNVTTIGDEAGQLVATYAYDGFGNIVSAAGSYSGQNRYCFSTKPIEDWAAEIYYYGYRYYAPRDGRWLSRDPSSETGGMNLYSLLSNSAVSSTDLLGLSDSGLRNLLLDFLGIDPIPISETPLGPGRSGSHL